MNRERLHELWSRMAAGDPLSEAEEQELLDGLRADAELRGRLLRNEEVDGLLRSLRPDASDAQAFEKGFEARLDAERDASRFIRKVDSQIDERRRDPNKSTARGSVKPPTARSRRRGPSNPSGAWTAALIAAGLIFAAILLVTALSSDSAPPPASRESASRREADRRKAEARQRDAELRLQENERRRKELSTPPPEPARNPAAEEQRKKALDEVQKDKERIERELREAIELAKPSAPAPSRPEEKPAAPAVPPQEKPAAPAVPPQEKPPVVMSEAVVAKVGRVNGEAYLVVKGEKKPAVTGQEIGAGQGIETGDAKGFIEISYADESRLEIGAGTVLRELKSEGGKRLTVEKGALQAEVKKQPKGQPLVIETPHGEATVLGTTLRIIVDPGPKKGTRLEVEEGKVQLKSKLLGKSVEVITGHYAVTAEGAELASKPIPPNLLADPGFEKGGRAWRLGPNVVVPPTFVKAGRSGSLALQAELDKSVCDVFQVVPVKAGEEYRATAWVKTQDLRTPSGGIRTAVVRLVWMDSQGKEVAKEEVGQSDPTQDWTRLTGRFIAPAQATTVRFALNSEDGSGTIWLDDCAFSRTGR
jgi:FecR-like protein/carbohydrate binding protein with CBM4/9 domain